MSRIRTADASVRTHRVLGAVSRVRILELLRRSDRPLDVWEVAETMGLHANTVRTHLEALVETDLASRRSMAESRPGRPRIVYEATDEQGDTGPTGYRLLAEVLAGYLEGVVPKPAAAAEEAGHAWGRFMAERPPATRGLSRRDSVRDLVGLLERLGFQPRAVRSESGTEIELRHCPFRDVASAHPDVACSVHLGLIRGALEEMGVPIRATRLRPFVTPALCVADLEPVPTVPASR